MRIVVNDIAASTGGAMTVLRDFYSTVCSCDKENQWIFLLSDRYFEETANVKIVAVPEVKKSKSRKLLFDFVSGRKLIRSFAPDVVLSLQNIITFGVKCPQVVYIHQSIPFQSVKRFSMFRRTERKLAIIQHLIGGIIKLSARKSDCVIVQTEWMREAVRRLCRLPQDKVVVNRPEVKQIRPGQTEDSFDKTAFFYPTADAVYKNNECIRKASDILDSKGIAHTVTMTLPPEKSCGSITCVGRLPYEAVISQYQHSALVFPSYIESLGYPMVEARAMGTVVLASDTPFSREVLAGYENAYFFDPFKPAELANLMEKVSTGEIRKKETCPQCPTEHDNWGEIMELVLGQARMRKSK